MAKEAYDLVHLLAVGSSRTNDRIDHMVVMVNEALMYPLIPGYPRNFLALNGVHPAQMNDGGTGGWWWSGNWRWSGDWQWTGLHNYMSAKSLCAMDYPSQLFPTEIVALLHASGNH
ncbi:hypothetical protein OSB04_024367 [Centaurea solstitialis]|uniref:Uncharacterized protein n=1 Tax=Centaurea solstitialis TaxID=347529 RepID=A0AA38SYB2_9ASTR|nr:hypothetical protein OSB04_024367 [Centaurea solstitialis]